jgi:hypothetical protein
VPAMHTPCPMQSPGQLALAAATAAVAAGVDPGTLMAIDLRSHQMPVQPASHAHREPLVQAPRPEQLKAQCSSAAAEEKPHTLPNQPGSQWQVLLAVHTPRELQLPGHSQLSRTSRAQSCPVQRASHRQVPLAHAPRIEQLPGQLARVEPSEYTVSRRCSHAAPAKPKSQTHFPWAEQAPDPLQFERQATGARVHTDEPLSELLKPADRRFSP